jgi:hypothetical protein
LREGHGFAAEYIDPALETFLSRVILRAFGVLDAPGT